MQRRVEEQRKSAGGKSINYKAFGRHRYIWTFEPTPMMMMMMDFGQDSSQPKWFGQLLAAT